MTFLVKPNVIRDISHGVHDFRIDGYFIHYITIKTREKKNYFCKLTEEGFTEKTEGKILLKAWKELPSKFANCTLGDFRIFPNEFHGILIFERTENFTSAEKQIPVIIGAFKSRAARLINLMHGKHNRIIWNNIYGDTKIEYFSELRDLLVFLSAGKPLNSFSNKS
jgi:hypothetical protein